MSNKVLKERLSNLEQSNKSLVVLSCLVGLSVGVIVILVLSFVNIIIYKSIINAVVFGIAAVACVILKGLGNYLAKRYVKEIESECD